MELNYNVALSARELLLVNAMQFASSLWFGWVLSFIFSEKTFQERQKKFAISAFRRIIEIENTTERIIARIRGKEKMGTLVGAELDALKEMALSLRSTVRSSKADWGDIIGDEIKILDEIAREKREQDIPNSETVSKIEELLSRLPSSLEIESREALNSDEIVSIITDNFRDEIEEYGYITLEGFWDKSFQIDILDLPIGSLLYISIDDVKDRVGALIAHSVDNKAVGVIANNSEVGSYSEFVDGLQRATNKSKFVAEYTKPGILIQYPDRHDDDDDDENVRHYFECVVKLDRPSQIIK